MTRERLTRAFLWLSITGWGVGLGAKLFDLIVVAGAWSASPPTSFSLLPYGPRFPIDPGGFFQPLSAIMAVGILGALIAGWKTRLDYRIWLILPALGFLLVWVFTPTVFWPMIRELYGTATGKLVRTDAQSIRLAERWITWDWMRIAVIAVAFFSCIRAISIPFPRER